MYQNTLPARTGKNFSTKNGGIVQVMDASASLPTLMMAAALTAPTKAFERAIGGVAGLTAEQRALIGPLFVDGHKLGDKVAQWVISSGGTLETRVEQHGDATVEVYDDSIVQAASAVGEKYGAVVIHTTPQTSHLQQHRRDGRLVMGGDIDDKFTGFDLRSDVQVIVRPDQDTLASDWSLDCPVYRKFASDLVKQGWIACGSMANGGLISLLEAVEFLALKIPMILVANTGRECDALILAVTKGDYSLVAQETKAKLEKRGKPLDDFINAVNRTKEVLGGIEDSSQLVHVAQLEDATTLAAGYAKFGLF